MRIEIEIPKEFEEHFKQDKFEDALYRLSEDAHLIAGNYEQETAMMLIKAFKESKPACDIDKVVEDVRCRCYEMGLDESQTELIVNEIVKQGSVDKDCNNCANYTEPDEVDNGCYLCCKGYENNYKPKADNGDVSDDVCEWHCDEYGRYHTECHYLADNDPLEYTYCPYCGKKILCKE